MTAASPMAEKVKIALTPYVSRGDRTNAAQAAVDACRAEETRIALQNLLLAMSGLPVLIFTGPLLEAVEASRTLLAKLDHISTEQPA